MIVLFLLLLFILCIGIYYFAYRKGIIYGLNKSKNEFKQYLEVHDNLKELLGPGLEAAEHIVNHIMDII